MIATEKSRFYPIKNIIACNLTSLYRYQIFLYIFDAFKIIVEGWGENADNCN